jgi:hypothetical protein
MQELKITLDDATLAVYRPYAERHGIALEEVLRRVLAHGAPAACKGWLEDFFHVMDEAGAGSAGRQWRRGDLYDV